MMAAEIEQAGSWVDAAVKAIGMVVAALFGWVWRTSHAQAAMRQREIDRDRAIRRIERGIGKIHTHITGVDLEDGD